MHVCKEAVVKQFFLDSIEKLRTEYGDEDKVSQILNIAPIA
jgi:hypothetical protein